MQYLVREISNKYFEKLCFLAVIGVWGMVSFKTGRLQQSIDTDFKTLAEAKSPDADTKKRVDYLHQVKYF